ncbi:uncharacterized protein METZ01_LOCUS404723, partial [marine metagenome]
VNEISDPLNPVLVTPADVETLLDQSGSYGQSPVLCHYVADCGQHPAGMPLQVVPG